MRGPPAGRPAAVLGDQRGQHPAPTGQPPGQVVHAGQPAQRRPVREFRRPAAGQFDGGAGPVRVEQLAEQLRGPGRVEQ
ncbi:hypothetical protein ACFQ2M_19830 [Kitasatospora saccharophila]|uniref:hypothetical protein n=1 Tax=Kitasatospora saccharophila TaxID=407973 RepID=UPI00363E8E71